jgi:hypothetical protein
VPVRAALLPSKGLADSALKGLVKGRVEELATALTDGVGQQTGHLARKGLTDVLPYKLAHGISQWARVEDGAATPPKGARMLRSGEGRATRTHRCNARRSPRSKHSAHRAAHYSASLSALYQLTRGK